MLVRQEDESCAEAAPTTATSPLPHATDAALHLQREVPGISALVPPLPAHDCT
jgi:hypothetical protein